MFEPFDTMAIVHSKEGQDSVKIVDFKDNNTVVAQYNGKLYTTIFNPFVGMFYVDDLYGLIEEH